MYFVSLENVKRVQVCYLYTLKKPDVVTAGVCSIYFMEVISVINTIFLMQGTLFVQENNQLWKSASIR